MSNKAGRVTALAISTDGGTTFTNLACLTDASFTRNKDELDITCKGTGAYRSFLEGFKDGTIEGTLHWDETDVAAIKIQDSYFGDTALRARWRLGGAASGENEHEANCIATEFSDDSPLEDVADVSFTLRLNGDFSPSAQP